MGGGWSPAMDSSEKDTHNTQQVFIIQTDITIIPALHTSVASLKQAAHETLSAGGQSHQT